MSIIRFHYNHFFNRNEKGYFVSTYSFARHKMKFGIFACRSESNICDSPRQYSPRIRQRCIIAEHQRQLHREMLEMHDTLTRGLRTRSQLPVWDSSSIGSWKSSVRSIQQCKRRSKMWNTVRGDLYNYYYSTS